MDIRDKQIKECVYDSDKYIIKVQRIIRSSEEDEFLSKMTANHRGFLMKEIKRVNIHVNEENEQFTVFFLEKLKNEIDQILLNLTVVQFKEIVLQLLLICSCLNMELDVTHNDINDSNIIIQNLKKKNKKYFIMVQTIGKHIFKFQFNEILVKLIDFGSMREHTWLEETDFTAVIGIGDKFVPLIKGNDDEIKMLKQSWNKFKLKKKNKHFTLDMIKLMQYPMFTEFLYYQEIPPSCDVDMIKVQYPLKKIPNWWLQKYPLI